MKQPQYRRPILFLVALVGLAVTAPSARADTCHPQLDAGKPQYMVGYGSLMDETSKRRTAPKSGQNQPVRISGYARAWNIHGSAISGATFLGVAEIPGGNFNAVIFSLPDAAEVLATDGREKRYCRQLIAPEQVTMLTASDVPDGQIWMYVTPPERARVPDKKLPIVQSYVDIFLTGCVLMGRTHRLPGFAAECVTSTKGWSEHWINDRIMPRRPLAYQPLAEEIDTLLAQLLPRQFEARAIE